MHVLKEKTHYFWNISHGVYMLIMVSAEEIFKKMRM